MLAAVFSALPLVAAAQPVKVYVLTQADPSGLVDTDAKARAAAVEGLSKTIGKSKTLQLVPTAAEAQIQVEIANTETVEETDSLSALNNALNGAHNSDTKKVKYRCATLRFGEYTTEIKGKDNLGNEAGLSRAIESWVKDNAGKLK